MTTLSYENDDLPWLQNQGYRNELHFYVNGKRILDPTIQPDQTLLTYLREELHLTGSKLGCAEGGCGACTVLISKLTSDNIEHFSVNACLMPICSVDGCHVTTIEGIGSVEESLHPVQEQMVKYHGSQCGFCTPGIVMALYTLLANSSDPLPEASHLEEHLDGNLCRCTGYRPIWDAAKSLCAGTCTDCPRKIEGKCTSTSNKKYEESEGIRHIFADIQRQRKHPHEVMIQSLDLEVPESPMAVVGSRCTWFQPRTLEQCRAIWKKFPDAKLVVGNTEVGIETKFHHVYYPRFVHLSFIPSLSSIEMTERHLVIGSCTPLSSVLSFASRHEKEDKVCKAIHAMLRYFASTQIRNVACLSGNIATASPISDMNPVLMAANATIEIYNAQTGEEREVPLDDSFFVSYRKVALEGGDIITQIRIPRIGSEDEMQYLIPYKQARRREDDISIACAAMYIKFDSGGIVSDANFAFGGMAPKPVFAKRTSAALIGKRLDKDAWDAARHVLEEELALEPHTHGGQEEYRLTLVVSFFYKFYLEVSVQSPFSADKASMEEEWKDIDSFLFRKKPSFRGKQAYPQLQPGGIPVVHQPIPHAAAALHCSGEAVYVDDIPQPQNMLHAALIMSTRAHCKIQHIDTSPAYLEGVVGVYTHKDLPKNFHNDIGPIVHDEEVFATEEVIHVGMPIGVVVADTLDTAQRAARSVSITYEELPGSPVVTIQDAIAANSYYDFARHKLETGNVEEEFKNSDAVIVEGTFEVGGQEHFYLECQTSLAIPSPDGGLEIFASTQSPTKTQASCAHVTNTPMNQVIVRTKRLGGGFGGKETRNVFLTVIAAVAAKISRRPVRLTLDRDVDMSITGGRHTFYAKYRAAAAHTSTGVKLRALDVKMYANAGCSFDLSGPIVDRALFHIDNVYNWPSFRAEGVPCKTMQPPHTAFRGFGGPQGMAICEHILDHLAQEMDVDVHKLRRENMYAPTDATPFGMVLGEQMWNVPRAWDELVEEARYEERAKEIAEFNRTHRWKKRGMNVLPVKFGIAFTAKFMNQGGALVHLYTDGTVLVSHGGTEMGQGLNTKVCQVAAQAFQIPFSSVHIHETATDKVANTIPTAASSSTDLYGMATLFACQEILERIKPIRNKLGPEATLAEVASAAFMERIDLSAHGFYKIDDDRCGFNWDLPHNPDCKPENAFRGHPFNYFTQGVAVSEVEIDVLSGDYSAIRSDITIDVGSSINPAIDIGQVEGAFIQGMGWATTEEMIWGDSDHKWVKPEGKLFTCGPGTYKIPAFNDIPQEFNVYIMDNAKNQFAVHSSKAVGEPPFFLGASVFFAIKEAIRAARTERFGSKEKHFLLKMPATSERIRMLCADEFVEECVLLSTGKDVLGYQPKGSY